jgi:threonine synthase
VLEKLAAAGRFAPDDTVVALITGNGLKTLDEHPQKEWPAKIDCELQPMLEALAELQSTPTLMQTAHEQLRA